MAQTTCPTCQGTNEETELFCTQCGSALIPQMNRQQLQAMADYDDEHSFPIARVGCLIGLVLGLGLAVLAYFIQRPERGSSELRSLGYLPIFVGLSGLIGGHVLGALIVRVRQRKYRRKWRRSHNRD